MKDFANIVAALILAVGLFAAATHLPQQPQPSVASVPGVSLYPQSVTTFTEGGGLTSISTSSSSYTLASTDIDIENYVVFTPLGANATLTLPATSTMTNIIPNAGDTRRILIENAATAATTTTIAAGAGMDLQEPDGQNVVIGQNNYAYLTLTRRSDTDIIVTVDETIPAD